MFNPLVKILGVIALVLTTAVNAEETDPFDITVYGSFLHTGTVPNALFFFNDIEQYDSFELRRAIRNHDIDIVVLASNGGSVWEGLNMAGIIHDKGIATYVPQLPEELGCYSACSFMFFGGKIRQADGTLAVHQAGAYGSERDKASAKVSETQQNTQFTVSEIIGFLNEFGTPPFVYEKMFRSRDFYAFTDEEKRQLSSEQSLLSGLPISDINFFITTFLEYLAQTKIETLTHSNEIQEPEKTVVVTETEHVKKVQELLQKFGCNPGPIDGEVGQQTLKAAEKWAQSNNLDFRKSSIFSEQFLELMLDGEFECPIASKPKSYQQWANFTCQEVSTTVQNTYSVLVRLWTTDETRVVDGTKWYFYGGTFSTNLFDYKFSTSFYSHLEAGKTQSAKVRLSVNSNTEPAGWGERQWRDLNGKARLNSKGVLTAFNFSDANGCELRSGTIYN